MIVLLSKDLFFVPVFKSAAEKFHQQVLVVGRIEDERLAKIDLSEVVAVVVDLGAISADTMHELATRIAELMPSAVRCAFGSHVHAGRLELAGEAGFDPVLTKGQVGQRLPRLVEDWIIRGG